MNSTSLVWLVVVVVLLAIGGWYFLYANPNALAPAATSPNTETPSNSDTSGGTNVNVSIDATTSAAPMSAAVTYGANGFSLKSVTIKVGGTVTWLNEGSGGMWVASAVHPTHSVYSGTNLSAHCDDTADTSFDQCKNGSSYSFTFTKVGTWNYHNHSQASDFGSVVVVK